MTTNSGDLAKAYDWVLILAKEIKNYKIMSAHLKFCPFSLKIDSSLEVPLARDGENLSKW